jgi:hypothetical protein
MDLGDRVWWSVGGCHRERELRARKFPTVGLLRPGDVTISAIEIEQRGTVEMGPSGLRV